MMTLKEEKATLVKLQDLDHEILRLESTLEDLPKQLECRRERLLSGERAFENLKKEYELLNRDLRSKERKLEFVEDNLRRLREKMCEIKTQKEMVALEHEMEIHGKEKSRLEDKILTLMEEIENLSRKIEVEEKSLRKEKEEFEGIEKEFRKKIDENVEHLNSKKKERGELCGKIRKDLIQLYEKLMKSKDNLAIVPVKNGSCQGCFMAIPPQVINEIRANIHLIRCENCVRILYWEG